MRNFMIAAALAAMTLAGCSASTLGGVMLTPALQLGESKLTSMPLYPGVAGPSICGHLATNRARATKADLDLYAKALRQHLPARDVELIAQRSYGTGMTFNGLRCLSPNGRVNDAFYPGVGHRWQVVYGSEYVYLEGDGTPEGMRVVAWN